MQPIPMVRTWTKLLRERVQTGFRSGLRHPERWLKGRAVGRHRARRQLLERLQLLAGLEPDSFPWRNRYLGSGAGVAANPGLARTHVEDSKASQLNSLAASQ